MDRRAPEPRLDRHVTVIVELTCEPAQRASLTKLLSEDGRIVSIDESSRGGDLLLTVMVPDVDALSVLLLDDLPAAPGVMALRPSVVIRALATGGDWRVGALTDAQLAEVARLQPPLSPVHTEGWPEEVRQLVAVLAEDGRASLAELARATDGHATTVRRRLMSRLADDRLALRCDLVHADFGLPVTSTYFAQVAPADLDRTIATLGRMATLRMCLQVTGEHNLIFSVLSPTVAAMGGVQSVLGKHLPWMRANESRVLLRSPKRMGWLFDTQGRPTGRLVLPALWEPGVW